MKNQFQKMFVGGGFAVLVAAFSTGCETCKPGRPGRVKNYSIEVKVDDSLKNSSVVVDLVGVNSLSLPRYEGYDMGKYWKAGDVMRRDADKLVLNFVSATELTKTVAITDAQWTKWNGNGATHLMVLADLPEDPTDKQVSKPGDQDPRRQKLSLNECDWPDKTTALRVFVKRSGVEVLTPVRPVRSGR